MNTNFVRQKVDSSNVQVKELLFNILALKIRFRSKLQKISRQKSPEKKRKIISEAWTGEISAARFGNLSPFGLLFQQFGDQYFDLAT